MEGLTDADSLDEAFISNVFRDMDNFTSQDIYGHVFPFEKQFNNQLVKDWVIENWISVCSWAGATYVLLVFSGQAYMSSRPAFKLRGLLTAWNIILAVFSIFGFLRTFPEFLHSLTVGGIYKTICDRSFVSTNNVSGFWTLLFILSKVPELVDTAFIVLRKQRLIFLHWYHHLTVLFYCWYCYKDYMASARWFMVMNYFVHSLMYSYFALRAMQIKIPKWVAMTITSLQLLQMVVGCMVNVLAFQFKKNGNYCGVSDSNLFYGGLMYTSYFVLFARFFNNAYFNKRTTDGTTEKGRLEEKKEK